MHPITSYIHCAVIANRLKEDPVAPAGGGLSHRIRRQDVVCGLYAPAEDEGLRSSSRLRLARIRLGLLGVNFLEERAPARDGANPDRRTEPAPK